MANKIQIRRDSAANWAAFNPILADGELGIDTTNGYMKFGDGMSPWTECQYVRFPGVGPENLAITGTPAAGTVGQAYSFVPTISGGTAPYTVASIGSQLPAGTGLNTNTGAITGSLSGSAQTYAGIILRVTDADGNVATLNLAAIVVAGAAQLTISGTPPTSATVGTAYSFTPTSTGGTGAKTFSLAAGSLPAGLSLNGVTGAITGTPTTAGTSSGIGLQVQDGAGATATLPSFSIVVASNVQPLTISGTPATTGQVGSAYNFTPTAAGGVAPRTFALIAGTLPAGLSFNTSTGAITGTPTTTGTATGLSIQVTDSVGTAATLATFQIAVAAAPVSTKPRFLYAAANPAGDAAIFNAAWSSATELSGSANGGKAGTFQTVANSTVYTWVFVPASAAPSGIRVFDGTGYGGFSGALSTGLQTGGDSNDPITTHVLYTAPDGSTYKAFRSNGRASNSPTLTIS